MYEHKHWLIITLFLDWKCSIKGNYSNFQSHSQQEHLCHNMRASTPKTHMRSIDTHTLKYEGTLQMKDSGASKKLMEIMSPLW